MLKGKKILVTGPAGQIASALCARLAADNEVWGIARFTQPGSRERVEALGVTTRVVDLADPDFSGLPEDFDHLLHLAAYMGRDLDHNYAIRVNAEATGLLLKRFRGVRAALVMSTTGVYRPHEDPMHLYKEEDPLGDARNPNIPTYAISKISEEAVARFCARAFDVPVVIGRMNSAYGPGGGLPAKHLAQILAGQPITLRWAPCPYSPIYEDDLAAHLDGVLSAASVPATIVNWGGDEPVAAQQWCRYLAELAGREADIRIVPVPGSQRGVALDVTRRIALTGPSSVPWREGIRRMYEARKDL